MKWNRKPKVLVMSDSSVLHTGFALVARKITTHLYESNNYEIKTIGWFHRNGSDTIVPFEIIPTKQDNPSIAEQDKYAFQTYQEVVNSYNPDIVLAIGDPWMVEHTLLPPKQRKHKLIVYIPVDGFPMMHSWSQILKNADTVVAYSEFGRDTMLEREKDLNIVMINHGVDTELFKPREKEEYRDVKQSLTNGEDLFIVGTVCRNQPRKNLPRLIKAGKLFINPYSVCNDCGEMVFENTDKCFLCGSENMTHGDKKSDVRFYFHMALNDCGWNIAELASRFNMIGVIAYPKGLQIGKGVSEETLAKIYNCMDVFTLPTGGEGWGLPILEAMSSGLPVIVPDYSAHVDFAKGVSELIKISEYITEPMTNTERGIVDIYDYAMRLDKLYMEDTDEFKKKWGKYIATIYPGANDQFLVTGKRARKFLSDSARNRALKYQWSRVNVEWEELINKTLEYSPSDIEKDYQKDISLKIV